MSQGNLRSLKRPTIPKQKTQKPTLSKQRLRLWLKLLKASRHVENEVRDSLRTQYSTTLPRFDVMAALFRNRKGLKMSELSDALRVSNGNVTGIVDRLTEDGAVVRVAVPGDRRAQLVRLTKKGIASFEAMAAVHEGWVNDIFSQLDAGDCDQLMMMLERVDAPAHPGGE